MIKTPLSRRPTFRAVVHASCQTPRWRTYDKSSLTIEALTGQVESRLGEDAKGNPLRINVEKKTVTTAAGDLPISPIFDPTWIKAQRRAKKDKPGKPTGRFRKKLANNPYARALATPLRACNTTAHRVPRFFLQDFELVRHPDTEALWWAPGPLSFQHLHYTKPRIPKGKPASASSTPSSTDGASDVTDVPDKPSTAVEASSRGATARSVSPLQRGPITVYTLTCKATTDVIGGRSFPAPKLLIGRTGMAISPEVRSAVWRGDMGEYLLSSLRRFAVDRLLIPSKPMKEDVDPMVVPCKTWDDVGRVDGRGCVLWLPQDDSGAREYATLDIDDAVYGKKIAVHNLRWLFGAPEFERLQHESPVFGENEILVLKQGTSEEMTRLHMLLWRLQGYLAPSAALEKPGIKKMK